MVHRILIHAPYGSRKDRLGSWRALVEAQQEGKVRSLGVSNYGVHHLEELKEYIQINNLPGSIDVGQWELHPWLGRKDIVDWCRANDVVVQAFCPLVRAKRHDDPVVVKLADKHNKTPAQILLRWSLQKVSLSVTTWIIKDGVNNCVYRASFLFRNPLLRLESRRMRGSSTSNCLVRIWIC